MACARARVCAPARALLLCAWFSSTAAVKLKLQANEATLQTNEVSTSDMHINLQLATEGLIKHFQDPTVEAVGLAVERQVHDMMADVFGDEAPAEAPEAPKQMKDSRQSAKDQKRRDSVLSLLQDADQFSVDDLQSQLKLHNQGPAQSAILSHMSSSLKHSLQEPEFADALVEEVLRMEEIMKGESALVQEAQKLAEKAEAMHRQAGGRVASEMLADITAQLPRFAKKLMPRIVVPHLSRLQRAPRMSMNSSSLLQNSLGSLLVNNKADAPKILNWANPFCTSNEPTYKEIPTYIRNEVQFKFQFWLKCSTGSCPFIPVNIWMVKLCFFKRPDKRPIFQGCYECKGKGTVGFVIIPIGFGMKTKTTAWVLQGINPVPIASSPALLREYISAVKTGFYFGQVIVKSDINDGATLPFGVTLSIASSYLPIARKFLMPGDYGTMFVEPMLELFWSVRSEKWGIAPKVRGGRTTKTGAHQIPFVVLSPTFQFTKGAMSPSYGWVVGVAIHLCPYTDPEVLFPEGLHRICNLAKYPIKDKKIWKEKTDPTLTSSTGEDGAVGDEVQRV